LFADKGFGFVEFADPVNAEKAIAELSESDLFGNGPNRL